MCCPSWSRAPTPPVSPTRARTRTDSSSGRAPAGFDGTAVAGPLGAQFLLWEYATAVTGKILGIDPFDQPNVAESKENTQKLLDQAGDGPLPEGEPVFTDGSVAVYGDAEGCSATRRTCARRSRRCSTRCRTTATSR